MSTPAHAILLLKGGNMADNKILETRDLGEQDGATSKFLTFALGDEEYGLEILKVREIIGLMDITSVPRMPGFVRGVINLRGRVIPVVDLRQKFNMAAVEDTQETCIIVIDLEVLLMGIVVDRVSEVLDIDKQEIDDTPAFGTAIDTDFIMGMGKVDQKVIILLDISKVLTDGDLSMLAQHSGMAD